MQTYYSYDKHKEGHLHELMDGTEANPRHIMSPQYKRVSLQRNMGKLIFEKEAAFIKLKGLKSHSGILPFLSITKRAAMLE